MKKHKKPLVWFVDDIQKKLDSFRQSHEKEFRVETFCHPTELLKRLSDEQPDAVLSDIFFYDSEEQSNDIERKINGRAKTIRRFAHEELRADEEKYLAGIKLIEMIHKKYSGNPPFPVYAYTSKGAYILDKWDRIINARARILPKDKLSTDSIQLEIKNDIEKYRSLNSFGGKFARNAWRYVVATGVLSAVLGAVLSWLMCKYL